MHGEPVTIEGSELLARAIQHETDHLDGILFIDRMDREQRKLALKAIREAEWAGRGPARSSRRARTPRSAGRSDRLAPSGRSRDAPGLRGYARRSRSRPWRRSPRPATSSPRSSPGRTHRPVAAAGSSARPSRTGRTPRGVPVLHAATAVGSRTSSPRSAPLAPDCCPVVAYGALVPQAALDVPAHGWVNLHFSLLPAWRGAAPVQRAVMAGDEVTGATTFRIEEGARHRAGVRRAHRDGPARRHRRRPARPARRRRGRAARRHPRRPSPTARSSPCRSPPDGVSAGPEDHRRGRPRRLGACPRSRSTGWCAAAPRSPGAWTTLRGERVKLGPVARSRRTAAPDAAPDPLAPGELVAGKRDVLVGTAGRAGAARRGAGPGQAADGRGRLGPRSAARAGEAFG